MEQYIYLQIVCFMAECYHMTFESHAKSKVQVIKNWDDYNEYASSCGTKFFTLVRPVAYSDAKFDHLVKTMCAIHPNFKNMFLAARQLIILVDVTDSCAGMIDGVIRYCRMSQNDMCKDLKCLEEQFDWLIISDEIEANIKNVHLAMI